MPVELVKEKYSGPINVVEIGAGSSKIVKVGGQTCLPFLFEEGAMNKLILVSDYSIPGVRSAKRIYELAKELKIKIGDAYLIVNRVSGPLAKLESEIGKTGLELIGEVPYSEDLVSWNISNRPIFEFKDDAIISKTDKIFGKLLKN